ncbi:unnamed protein product [Ranitomeya imitator]|uniref:Securin n=1 Tax=Ranitomeya imitator TaxID=111125 RepID=A0ABN9LSP2_9NEOB|nr:unnamed protein product [Ranitomeya imitator]
MEPSRERGEERERRRMRRRRNAQRKQKRSKTHAHAAPCGANVKDRAARRMRFFKRSAPHKKSNMLRLPRPDSAVFSGIQHRSASPLSDVFTLQTPAPAMLYVTWTFLYNNLTIMATMIYIDQENSDVNAALSSKDRAQQSGAGKSLVKSHQGKVHGSASRWKTARKALGNVNKQVMKNAQPLAGDQVPVPSVKQVSGSCVKTDAQQYPPLPTRDREVSSLQSRRRLLQIRSKIDIVCTYPEDFETFDVPEEHKLSHLSLVGVGLIVHVNDAKRFESLSLEPELMEIPALGWESDAAGCLPSFLATLEEIIVEMPPIE